jgi:hypothetical protein
LLACFGKRTKNNINKGSSIPFLPKINNKVSKLNTRL